MMTMVKDMNGNEVYYNAAVALMDDDIREELAAEMAPCTDQEFFTAYEKAHKEKFGEEFVVNSIQHPPRRSRRHGECKRLTYRQDGEEGNSQ